MLKKIVLIILSLILLNNNANAECRCVCMNQEAVRMCDNSFDYQVDCYSMKMRCK